MHTSDEEDSNDNKDIGAASVYGGQFLSDIETPPKMARVDLHVSDSAGGADFGDSQNSVLSYAQNPDDSEGKPQTSPQAEFFLQNV